MFLVSILELNIESALHFIRVVKIKMYRQEVKNIAFGVKRVRPV